MTHALDDKTTIISSRLQEMEKKDSLSQNATSEFWKREFLQTEAPTVTDLLY